MTNATGPTSSRTNAFVPQSFPDQLRNAVRAGLIASAIIGIIVGIVALVWPEPTLLVVALLFGITLIFTGVYRLTVAFSAKLLPTSMRVFFGIMGAIVLIAGIICLFNPGESLVLLAIVIGVGWIFQGAQEIAAGLAGAHYAPKWFLIGSGVFSVVAGIIVLFLPGAAIATFLIVGAILLVVVSVVTLLTLPRAAQTPAQAQ
ncbi:HdeD family acid-resistance protein [Williamsia muralis]|uniref:HdeD family acid-resistance protein n=1 Tax=Williamsia marianensis TaxID=85044 RepID=UPI0037F7B539